MMLRLLLPLILFSSLVFAACGDEFNPDAPPEIEYGRDTCDRCHMIISEERHASGLVSPDGETLVFDDPGEMISMIQEDPQRFESWRVWVHDYDLIEWIDGATAFYVHSEEFVTPMGTGIIAFEDRHAAETFAIEYHGDVLDWNTVLTDWHWDMHGDGH